MKTQQRSTGLSVVASSKVEIVLSIAEIILEEQRDTKSNSPDAFGADFSPQVWINVLAPFHVKLSTVLKKLGCRHNDKLKLWSFEFSLYKEVVRTLLSDEFFDTHHVVEVPRFLLKGLTTFLNKLLPPSERPKPDLSTFMMDTLLPFQMEGLKFVISRRGKAMIADEMGCGKTVSAIAVIEHYRKFLPALVLCPPTLIKTWEKALAKFGEGFLKHGDVKTLGSKGTAKGKNQPAVDKCSPKVFVVPYTMLAKLTADGVISPHQFGIVIADESHNLKEKESQRTIRALPYLKQATVTVALTGTPEVNRPVELFTQVHAIRPDIFDDYQGFVKRYCDAKEGRHGQQDVSGSSNEAELKHILTSTVMIRRLKNDVLNDLANKCREIRKIPADPAFLDEYKALDRRYQLVLDKLSRRGGGGGGFQKDLEGEKSMLQTQQYMQTGLCKVKEVVRELEQLVLAARKFSNSNDSRGVKQGEEEIVCNSESKKEDVVVDISLDDTNDDNDDKTGPAAVISTLEMGDFIQSPQQQIIHIRQDSEKHVRQCEDDALDNSSSSDDDMSTRRIKKCATNVTGKKRLRRAAKSSATSNTPKRRLGRGRVAMAIVEAYASESFSDDSGDDGDNDEYEEDIDVDDDEDEEELFFCDRALPAGKQKPRKAFKSVTSVGCSGSAGHGNVDISILSSSSDDDEDTVKKSWQSIFGSGKDKAKSARKTKSAAGTKAEAKTAGTVKESAKNKKINKSSKKSNLKYLDCDESDFVENDFRQSKKMNGLLHKIVVFAHHKRVMDALETALLKLQVSYCRVDGETSQSKRTQLLDDFQDGDVYDVALLSITACGTGLTLTRANVALFAELAWSCGTISQAEDRIHRIGQIAESVRIIYMICDDTADRYMWPKIQEKFKNIGNTIGMKDSNLGATCDDIDKLGGNIAFATGRGAGGSAGARVYGAQSHQSLMDNYVSASQVYGGATPAANTPTTAVSAGPKPASAQSQTSDIVQSSRTDSMKSQNGSSTSAADCFLTTSRVSFNPYGVYGSSLAVSHPEDDNKITIATASSVNAVGAANNLHTNYNCHLQQSLPAHADTSSSGQTIYNAAPPKDSSSETTAALAMKARIEENKRKAQLRLQKTRIAQQQAGLPHGNKLIAGTVSSSNPILSNPTSLMLKQTLSAPAANDPSVVNTGQLFSTGGGTRVAVSEASIQRVNCDGRYSMQPDARSISTASSVPSTCTIGAPMTSSHHANGKSLSHLSASSYLQARPTEQPQHIIFPHPAKQCTPYSAASNVLGVTKNDETKSNGATYCPGETRQVHSDPNADSTCVQNNKINPTPTPLAANPSFGSARTNEYVVSNNPFAPHIDVIKVKRSID